jgi:RimJ/RimL family protein N-acetyltransferase
VETIPLNIPDILTARLRLVAITADMLDAESAHALRLQPLLHARVPAEWPDDNWEPHVFDYIRKQYADHPETMGWMRYVVLPGDDPVLIGTVGAGPRKEHEVEFGYAILKPWQRRGFATEAARTLLNEVFANPTVESVIAHTYPHLQESIRVMEKCGLVADGAGDEEGTVRYRLRRAAMLPSS